MDTYVVKPLSVDTWDAFARLVERHNGVFGGCWCTWFHTFQAEKTFTAEATTRSSGCCKPRVAFDCQLARTRPDPQDPGKAAQILL